MELFSSYGIEGNHIFKSHLCIDNERFLNYAQNKNRSYHLMFSGRFSKGKIPEFFVNVVKMVSSRIKELSLLVIGDGPLRNQFLAALDQTEIEYDYMGFIDQADLPHYYSDARILLLTTLSDAWGIVANEALASGTPVIVTPYAGIVNDLVIDGYNGFVIDLEPEKWADKVIQILMDNKFWQKLSDNSVNSVEQFNYQNAAEGIIHAGEFAL